MVFHLEDLEADFRVFYRLTPEDIVELTGPHFLALAQRVSAYAGVIQARAAEQEDRNTTADGEVESTPQALQQDPALADLIDYG